MLLRRLFASFVLATSLVGTAAAADKVNVASSLRGFWDTTMVQFGQERGFFASEGLDLNIFWTDGGSDILQVVNSGSVDIGIGTGVMGALGAYARGAPLRIIANEFVGSSDLYYFVRSDSSVLSFKDLEGKNVGVARLGSSSESVGGMLAKQYNVRVKFTPTGGTAATMTQVMTKQVDAAWCVFPVFLQQIDKGEIRVIALGKDASGIAEQTTRVNIASKSIIENRPEVLRRFLRAYRRTIDYAYGSDDIPRQWAEMNNISLETAKRVLTENFQKQLILPTSVGPIGLSIEEAVKNKYIARAMTDAEVKEMFRLTFEFNQ